MLSTFQKQLHRNASSAHRGEGSALARVKKAMMSVFAIECGVSDRQNRALEIADLYWIDACDRERAELSDELHGLGLHHYTRSVALSAWAHEELRAHLSGTRSRYALGVGTRGAALVGASHALPSLGR